MLTAFLILLCGGLVFLMMVAGALLKIADQLTRISEAIEIGIPSTKVTAISARDRS